MLGNTSANSTRPLVHLLRKVCLPVGILSYNIRNVCPMVVNSIPLSFQGCQSQSKQLPLNKLSETDWHRFYVFNVVHRDRAPFSSNHVKIGAVT